MDLEESDRNSLGLGKSVVNYLLGYGNVCYYTTFCFHHLVCTGDLEHSAGREEFMSWRRELLRPTFLIEIKDKCQEHKVCF